MVVWGVIFCLVDAVLDGTFSWEGTVLLVSAVVFGRFCIGFIVDGLTVMG